MSISANLIAPGEKPIRITRQHPIVLFLPALLNLTAIYLLTALSLTLERSWFLVFYIVPLTGFLLEFLSWRKKLYLLTDSRLIKREGLLATSIQEFPLDTIQGVTPRWSPPGRLLQYGKIRLETSTTPNPVTFHFIPKPEAFKNRILQECEASRIKPA